MKKPGALLRIAVCVLFVLSALGFAAIEGWHLVTGDWKLFENGPLALGQIIVRILLALYCLLLVLRVLRQKKASFLWEGAQLFAVALAAAPFISNRLGWLFVFLAGLLLLAEVWAGRALHPRRRAIDERQAGG